MKAWSEGSLQKDFDDLINKSYRGYQKDLFPFETRKRFGGTIQIFITLAERWNIAVRIINGKFMKSALLGSAYSPIYFLGLVYRIYRFED